MMTNEEYIHEYIETRGLSKTTYQSTKLIMNHYSNFQEKSLHELIIEADDEEENRIRWKRRKLKTRLTNYMNYLRENMTLNSAKTYLKIVKSFYRHHEIEIHSLPKLNEKNSIVIEPITYADLPDKEIIRKAVEMSEPLMRALILFLSSSGLSKVDALNLTIGDFIKATEEYHHKTGLFKPLAKLWEISDDIRIIPTFRARRQKTNKYFITFCSHEATIEILQYLAVRSTKRQLHAYDKLFQIEKHYYTIKFAEINDAMELGKRGKYNRFRGHMLRKFHASNLNKGGMDRYEINVLQGKSNGSVDDVYFFEDTDKLKADYIKAMPHLLIGNEHIIKTELEITREQLLEKDEELAKVNDRLASIEDKIRSLENTPRSKEEILRKVTMRQHK